MDCLKNGRPNPKYSENMRQFCLALFYYSPNAYRYVRSVFQKHLPEPRTIRAWLESIDGSPGITKSALDALENKAKEYEANGKQLFVALIDDEIAIKKKVD